MLVGSMGPVMAGHFKSKGGAGLLEELGNKVQKEVEKAERKAAMKADAAARNTALDAAAGAVDAAKRNKAAPKIENPVALEASDKAGKVTGTNPGKKVEQTKVSNYIRPEVEEAKVDGVELARQEALKAQEKIKLSEMISSLASVETKKAVALLQPAAEGAKTPYSAVLSAYAENSEEAA